MVTIAGAASGKWLLHGACVALVAWATFGAVAEDNVRCRNGKLVKVGMVAAEVKARCGEPSARDVEEVPVRARTPSGNVIITGTARLERWTYSRGQGQFDALLSFDSEKLVSIELLTSR